MPSAPLLSISYCPLLTNPHLWMKPTSTSFVPAKHCWRKLHDCANWCHFKCITQTQSSLRFPISINGTTTHPDSQARNNSWNSFLSHSPRCCYHVQHESRVYLLSLSATTLSRFPSFPTWTTEIASELVSHFHSDLLLVYSQWKNERDLLTPTLGHDCRRYCLPIYPYPPSVPLTSLTMAYHCF